jgi:aquaporin Z
MSLRSALREHWPEYLIEGWALGCFMISIGVFVTVLISPMSPLYTRIPSLALRAVMLGLALGTTAIVLIHSPWGKRSGAHMNPAVTLAFLRAKKIHHWDALFYVIAQTIGGILGVIVVAFAMGDLFTSPPVSYAVTLPGPQGAIVAFAAEALISFALMATVLIFTASMRLTRYTGLAIGCLVALFVAVEFPLSGASMNPARTLASAAPGHIWQNLWVYLLAPTLGMLAAAQLHLSLRGAAAPGCAKLLHPKGVRCIHCGQQAEPEPAAMETMLQCRQLRYAPSMRQNSTASPTRRSSAPRQSTPSSNTLAPVAPASVRRRRKSRLS